VGCSRSGNLRDVSLNIATPATLEGRQTVSSALSFGELSEGDRQ
jgi:hypothetical protein